MSKALKKLIDINGLREFKNKLVGTGSAYVQTGAVDQTIAGTKTFSKPIVGSVTGSSGSCTGNAATATTATTATTAESCTGNAATATKLATARSLWGNNFDGSAAITGMITGTPAIELMPPATSNHGGYLDFHYNQSTADYTSRIIESASGTLSINNVTITTGRVVTAATFNGALTGNVTGNCSGSSGSCTGNAATATKAVSADSATNASHATSADSAANADHATSADSATRATSADRASAADHIQGQTSAYHEIRFDWDSQVPGHVGLRVDVTDMGGIVTTYSLVSDIRAQWYAAYPDGAEAHNAMWGGRDITAAFDAGIVSEHIADGTFKDIFPGDYITKRVIIFGNTYTVNWVVADCDYWINKGDTAMTAHHVAIVPQVPIFDASMNATNATEGGYKGSAMYKNMIPACATSIVNAFGSDHILTFRDAISNSVDTSHVSSGIPQWTGTPGWWGEWVSVRCNLMSEKMVYGAPICSAGAADNTMATRQMSAFRLSERLINYNRGWWWLRDVVASTHFAHVYGYGYAAAHGASSVLGVRPFALLK